MSKIYVKPILWFGGQCVLACDGNCQKAFGHNGGRPRIEFNPDDPDDFAYLADDEVGTAPEDPGTYEGRDGKPDGPAGMNKWCARECERSVISEGGVLELSDFSKRLYNQPWLHPEAREGA